MYPPVGPILVQLGPIALHWYGITMTLAILLGTLVAGRYVTRRGGDGAAIWDMLLWVLIPALIGARLYYVFIQSPRGPNGLDRYLSHPFEIFQIWNGGIHIYGALIFGGIALLLYLRLHKLPYLLYLDGIALGLTLGQTIGRLGNFINQELYGPPTTLPWGLRIDEQHRIPPYDDMTRYPDSVRFQPLFLYEMLWDGIGFLLLLWIARRFQKRLLTGDLFLLYLIWVPLGRFLIEFMRTDSWFFPGTPFNLVHLLTACAIIGATVVLVLHHRSRPATQAIETTPSAATVSEPAAAIPETTTAGEEIAEPVAEVPQSGEIESAVKTTAEQGPETTGETGIGVVPGEKTTQAVEDEPEPTTTPGTTDVTSDTSNAVS